MVSRVIQRHHLLEDSHALCVRSGGDDGAGAWPATTLRSFVSGEDDLFLSATRSSDTVDGRWLLGRTEVCGWGQRGYTSMSGVRR